MTRTSPIALAGQLRLDGLIERSVMSDITGLGWTVIIAAALFLVASIRTIGLFPTILAITTLFFWFLFKE
jgi:hypothetical protein